MEYYIYIVKWYFISKFAPKRNKIRFQEVIISKLSDGRGAERFCLWEKNYFELMYDMTPYLKHIPTELR